MIAEQICHNGVLQPASLSEKELPSPLPSLYQRIRITGAGSYFLESHLAILHRAFGVIYPDLAWPLPAQEEVERALIALLKANRYTLSGAIVTLRISVQEAGGETSTHWNARTAPLFYPQYDLWHTRPRLTLFPCDYFYMGYPTSVSEQIGAYGTHLATRCGADCAVLENMDGTLTNINDEPLFIRLGSELLTSPLQEGATDSVMRRLVMEACRRARIECREVALNRSLLEHCDECFTTTPEGILSMDSYKSYRYFNILPGQLLPFIRKIARDTVL